MYAFRAISLLAAIAFTSAIPLGNDVTLPGAPSVPSLPGAPGLSNTPGLPQLGTVPGVPSLPSLPSRRRDAPKVGDVSKPSFPDVCQGATDKLQPIIGRLRGSVAVEAKIDVDVVVEILQEVIVVLTGVVTDLQALVNDPVGFVLGIPEVADIIYTLLSLVLEALALVISAVTIVGATALAAVVPLVLHIGSLLASVIGLALVLVPGLLATLVKVVASLVPIIYRLNLADVVKILGLAPVA